MIRLDSVRGTREQRFMVQVHQETNGCWRWLGCFDGEPRDGNNPRGRYGRFALDGYHMMGAHRASYLLFRGPIADHLQVCHSCDMPWCVNPHHLFLGTIQDNMDDQCLKQRGAWQKKGWISPRTGTGNLVFFNNYYAVPAICFICSVKTFQHVGSSKRKSPATCSKKCKAILFAWYAHNRKNKR